ncbi:MAG: hypothetical protein ABR521_11715 [Gaiellaceae bacterium]
MSPATYPLLTLGGLDWPHEQTVTSSGVRIRLRSTSPEGIAALLARLPGQWRHSTATRVGRTYTLASAGGADGRSGEYVLYEDAEERDRSSDLDWVLASFAGSAGFYIGERSVLRTFVHAGAVGWRGHAIVLPGREGTGKTTLTAALVRAGATYLSDDYVPIDDRGHAHPFPRPLAFKRRPQDPVEYLPVEALGGVQETRTLPAGLVVLAPYRGLERWRPRRLPPGRAVLELLANCLSAQSRPRQALERLGGLVTAAPVLKGGRGDADETAALILARLESALARRP